MSITKLRITNFKSLKNIKLDLGSHSVHCILGRNGTGKTNIFEAVNHFYEHLLLSNATSDIIDKHNPFTQFAEIELTFNFDNIFYKNENEYLAQCKSHILKYTSNNQITLKLKQFKDGSIKWSPDDIKLNEHIKKIFPYYYIDTRKIATDNWDKLWDIITDLSKSYNRLEQKNYEEIFDTFLESAYGTKAIKSIEIIKKDFDKGNIKINEFDYAYKFKSALMARFGGREFIHDGEKLNYYSDGMNSLNFLKLSLSLIPKLADMGWKSPLIIIDEIEIGLHPQYISNIAKHICENFNDSKNCNLVVSSHSSAFVSDLIKNEIELNIYRVSISNKYSTIDIMKPILNREDRVLISPNDSMTYFSEGIAIVEGITEIQLFRNKNIVRMFPEIERVDFIEYNSNNNRLKIMGPNNINFNTPYLLIVDMDKILDYKSSATKFKIHSDHINPLCNKDIHRIEKNLYYSKFNNTKFQRYNIRQFINKTLDNSNFILDANKIYIDDIFYLNLRDYIKEYCNEYNVWPVDTTIEGVIINEYNYEIFYDWIKVRGKLDMNTIDLILDVDKTWSLEGDSRYRSLILRLIFKGKLDTLEKINDLKANNSGTPQINSVTQNVKGNIVKLQVKAGTKADGWIIDFIQFYFDKLSEENLLDSDIKERFEKNFPELNNILTKLSNMVQSI